MLLSCNHLHSSTLDSTIPDTCMCNGFTGQNHVMLASWYVKPGWASVTEMLYRGKQRANCLDIITVVVLSVARAPFLMLLSTKHAPTLRGRVSLAGTVRKLLWPYLQLHGARPQTCGECQRLPLSTCSDELQWDEGQRKNHLLHVAIRLLPVLDAAVSALNKVCVSNHMNCSSSEHDDSTRGQASNHNTHVETKATRLHLGGPQQRSHELVHSLLHQLQAVSLVTVVQVCRWRMECERTSCTNQHSTPYWLASVRQTCEHLHNQDLKVLMASMLSEKASSTPQSQLKMSVDWERYAVAHFHGRLLPGCCHLGCTNLDEVSEAAVKTQLCSGCKGARYCSVECQRAAWREGGHSAVCGQL